MRSKESVSVINAAEPATGWYAKFRVKRLDGGSRKGEKHEHCAYFVLDLNHDKFAEAALKAYAEACRDTHADLAEDLLIQADLVRARIADAALKGNTK